MIYLNARIKPNDENNSELVLFKYNYNLTFCNYKTNYKNIKRKEYSDYKFNNVFDQNDKNLKIYLNTILPNIYSPSFFILYGYTNSGKTHTLFGNDNENGVLDYIANKLQYVFSISAIELSYSGLKDLLNDFKTLYCYAVDKDTTNYIVKKKKFEEISNINEYRKLVEKIKINRGTRKTNKNNSSSRSHLIITLKFLDNEMHLLDLAGNENKPNFSSPSEILEAGFINSSLMSLKECVRRKKAGDNYIPYRNNMLTKIISEIFVQNTYVVNFLFTFNSTYNFKSQIIDTLNFYKNLSDVKISNIKNYMYDSKYQILKPKKVVKKSIKLQPIKSVKKERTNLKIDKYPSPPSIKYDVNKILSPHVFKKSKQKDIELMNPFELPNKSEDFKNLFDNSKFKDDFLTNFKYPELNKYNKRENREKAKNKVELISNLLYRRAIKNFVKLNLLKKNFSEKVNNQIISETIATLEVILDELNNL